MKSIYLSFIVWCLFLIILSCNSKEKPAQKEQVSLKVSDLTMVKDPVCKMKLIDETIADTAHYQGKVIGFCAPGCKSAFLKNPDSFLSQN